jgi:hypothetical protein
MVNARLTVGWHRPTNRDDAQKPKVSSHRYRARDGWRGVSRPAATAGIYDRVDVRRAEQTQRIQQGIRTGELNRSEAAKLKAQQAHIRYLERKAERDGRNTRSERARINAAQNASSRSIYAEKHDSQDRNRRFGKRYGWNKGAVPHKKREKVWKRWF